MKKFISIVALVAMVLNIQAYLPGLTAKADGMVNPSHTVPVRPASFPLSRPEIGNITVSAGMFHTVGLKSDGTVLAVGDNNNDQCNVSGWKDIVAVSAGSEHTVGLKSNGRVVAVGYNEYNQCDVSGWTDIVAVSAGESYTLGLKSDGTVLATGWNNSGQCNVLSWTDIVAIDTGANHSVGLKSDGTVVAVGNSSYYTGVSSWTDIVEVSAGYPHTIGLKSDGTVVASVPEWSFLDVGQYNISDWSNMAAVSAGSWYTVGLKSDGTVIAIGRNEYGRCDVEGWTDIIAVSAGGYQTVGLKSDGTVVTIGPSSGEEYIDYGQCNTQEWMLLETNPTPIITLSIKNIESNSVNVNVTCPQQCNPVLIIMIYDINGKLFAAKMQNIEKDGDITVTGITIPAVEGTKVKAMIWDRIENMTPLCNPKTATITWIYD